MNISRLHKNVKCGIDFESLLYQVPFASMYFRSKDGSTKSYWHFNDKLLKMKYITESGQGLYRTNNPLTPVGFLQIGIENVFS